MPTGSQIRAARALLGWGAPELAERIGMRRESVLAIENGNKTPRPSTVEKIIQAFEKERIEFLDNNGVRQKDDTLRVIEGDDPYLQLLDDVFHTLSQQGGEVLFLFCDDRVTTKQGKASEDRLRASGIKLRSLVEKGNKTINGPLQEYRAIPSKFFNHDLVVVYADKVAQTIGKNIIVVRNESFARTMRLTFEFMWQNAEQPRKG